MLAVEQSPDYPLQLMLGIYEFEHAGGALPQEFVASRPRPRLHGCDSQRRGIRIDSSLDGIDWARAGRPRRRRLRQRPLAGALRRSFEQSRHVAIARDGDSVVGMARLLSDGVCNAYLVDVWTASSHRRQGIAAQMRLLIAAVPGQHIGLQTDDAQELYRASASSRSPSSGRSCPAGGWTTRRTGFEASRRTCQTDRVSTTVDALELDAAAFRGEIFGPADAGFEEHRRIWNGSIDRRPAAIARCAGVADVIAAVKAARASGVPVAIRSGGHSFPGYSVADDALVIDLSPMKGVRVDPERRIARAQAGVLLGELDRETQAFGLAVPSGIVTHTGVAGLTLGGGIGWIMRKHGLSVDRLRSVDLVTADGEFVKASADENAELFWGLRGGGGNFGIVTEFEFDCVPLGPQILAGPVIWPMTDSGDVLRFYRDWIAEAPDDLMTIIVHRKAPPLPIIPEELHGQPVVMVICCWVGDLEEGERFIKPLRDFGSPVADVCVPKPYLAHQAMLDPSFVPGRWYYFKSCDVAELTDEIIDLTMERSLEIESPLSSFPIWQMGGAVSRVGEDETAFNGRGAGFTYNIGVARRTRRASSGSATGCGASGRRSSPGIRAST